MKKESFSIKILFPKIREIGIYIPNASVVKHYSDMARNNPLYQEVLVACQKARKYNVTDISVFPNYSEGLGIEFSFNNETNFENFKNSI